MERRSTTRLNRTSQTLGLWMNGAYVGTWSLGLNAPDTLQYDPDWTRSEQGRPLSLSLPFMPGNTPHRGPHVRAWFENLLPDSKDIRWLKPAATVPARCRSCRSAPRRPAWPHWRRTH
jgi:serine/threonine-protein kinase HipA